jgi:hypothetical protein
MVLHFVVRRAALLNLMLDKTFTSTSSAGQYQRGAVICPQPLQASR